MFESKTEDGILHAEKYLQRIEMLSKDVRGWCAAHNLTVTEESVTLREMDVPDYDAPVLKISSGGVVLARLEPVASRVMCAEGRVDLIGRFTRQMLLFRITEGPTYPMPHILGLKNPGTFELPGSVATQDGWYWTESHLRRLKPITEILFLDLLTDVSDYEF